MQFKKERRVMLLNFITGCASFWFTSSMLLRHADAEQKMDRQGVAMKLPHHRKEGTVSVEQAISQRRTVRAFRSEPLDLTQLSQLLWAAQGITGDDGFKRAAPSAGALYPMDIYVVSGTDSVGQIEAGVFHFSPSDRRLSLITGGDLRNALARESLSQMWMAKAPVNFVITAEYDRATVKYGKRGVRYAMIEAGHIAQNLFLQAEAMGLKAGIVGAFRDNSVIRVLRIPYAHEPLLIMPVGYPA